MSQSANSPILSAQNISKTHGDKLLFADAAFGVNDGERIALIGANGAGKTTLLRVLAGIEPTDKGMVVRRTGSKVEVLAQDPPFDPEHTVAEHIFHAHGELAAATAAYEAACAALEADHHSEIAADRLADATHRMDDLDAWEYESQAKIVLSRLGVTDLEARMGQLSGGYRRRIALARSLMSDMDLLILDEPTNHLDADTVAWLEEHLRRAPHATLVVTHDRYFLDRVATRLLEVGDGIIRQYEGNFGYYLERKAEQAAAAERGDEIFRTHLRRELEWLRRGARARRTKEKHRVERVHEMMDQRRGPKGPPLEFTAGTRRLGSKIAEFEDVGIALGGRTLIDGFTHSFAKGDRIGVVGPNGCGKSTFVNMLSGQLQPDTGTIEVGETVHFGLFGQEGLPLKAGERAIEFVKREGGEMLTMPDGKALTAGQMMDRFGFTPQMQHSDATRLSGGERRRLQLVTTLLRDPNFLVLDEPTNDLDIATLQALEGFLEDFAGCLLVVSHDRYFLDRTVDELLAFEGDGVLRLYQGPFEAYRKLKADRDAEAAAAPAKPAKPAISAAAVPPEAPAKPAGKKLSFKEARELADLEAYIPQWEKRAEELHAEMAAAATDFQKLSALTAEQTALTAKLETGVERWTELAERAG